MSNLKCEIKKFYVEFLIYVFRGWIKLNALYLFFIANEQILLSVYHWNKEVSWGKNPFQALIGNQGLWFRGLCFACVDFTPLSI